MMKFIGGLITGAALLGVGVALGKPSPRSTSRKHLSYRSFRRSRRNTGFEARKFEREALAYIREAREMIQELRNPKDPPKVDAEFITEPVPDPQGALLYHTVCETALTSGFCNRCNIAPSIQDTYLSTPEKEDHHRAAGRRFGTANEPGRSQDVPPEAMKRLWRVVQDGLGNWNVWEWGPSDGLAPKSIALSLTEENARKIVTDHNRNFWNSLRQRSGKSQDSQNTNPPKD